MKNIDAVYKKIYQVEALSRLARIWQIFGKSLAFTNGCFDILHEGHIFSLSEAAKTADKLIVGINSDASIRRLKGATRPINNVQSRALVLASLLMVDAVVVFEEETPLELIKTLAPNVLVKGGDYTIDQIVGAKEVIANGGSVVVNKIVAGFSTTETIKKIKATQ